MPTDIVARALAIKANKTLPAISSTDAGKLATVDSNGKWVAANLTVGQGEVAVDSTLLVSGAAADAKVTGDKVNELKSALTGINEEIVLTQQYHFGGYISLSGSIGSTVSFTPTQSSARSWIIVSCSAGDKFVVTGIGGSNPRLWGFLDKDRKLLSVASQEVSETNKEVTASQDGFFVSNIHASSTYNLTEKKQNRIFANLKEFGAVGDGVTDDTIAIQRAINECNHGTLVIPNGTYIFSRTLYITDSITIIGSGTESILKLASTFTLDKIDWRADAATAQSKYKYPMINIVQNTKNCILKNFTLEGQTTTFVDQNEDGLTIQGSNHILDNITVHNINYFKDSFTSRTCVCPAWGINVFNALNVLVTNCHVYDCGYECIGTENCDNVTITESQFGDGCQTSTQIHRKSKHIKFTENYVYQTENVRSVNCPAFTMDANPNSDEEMNDILALGNTLLSHVNTVAGGEHNVRIQNNYIKGIMSSNQHIVYPNGLLISGNKIDGRINMCADNAYVYGNIINNDTQNYMIRIYGNNSVETANHGIGIGNGTTIVTH